ALPPASNRHTVSQPQLRDLSFWPLPGAEKEGRVLYERARQFGFQNAVLYLGTNANHASLREIHSPNALHFATHAFVLPEIDILHEDRDAKTAPFQFAVGKLNPMLRCGLALAGAQRTVRSWAEGKNAHSDFEGIVTAAEIGALDLRGTRLVVLSA